MEEAKFRLVFKAEIAPGSDLNEVKKELGLLFKSEVSKIETLFSGKLIVLKNNLSELVIAYSKGNRCEINFYLHKYEGL